MSVQMFNGTIGPIQGVITPHTQLSQDRLRIHHHLDQDKVVIKDEWQNTLGKFACLMIQEDTIWFYKKINK